jgi:glyoxylase-like metal-dependent hydrolase (beta-lactamase superfamily II)
MKMKAPIALLIVVVAGCGSAPEPTPSPEAPPLQIEVYTSGDYGYSTTSTLVYGENDLILIDPQFLASEARAVAERIRATGRTLTTVYTTHAHPDHYLGVATILEEFPDAAYVAVPEVAERMVTSWPARRNFWVDTYGDELPSADAILPTPLEGPMMLEGNPLIVTKELMGDGPGNTFVHIPAIGAVVAGDIVFSNAHFGVPEDPTALYETLAMIDALNPAVLVAGHQAVGTPNDPAATDFMRNYILDFKTFTGESGSSEELKMKMLERYPNMAMVEKSLDGAVTRAFPE